MADVSRINLGYFNLRKTIYNVTWARVGEGRKRGRIRGQKLVRLDHNFAVMDVLLIDKIRFSNGQPF